MCSRQRDFSHFLFVSTVSKNNIYMYILCGVVYHAIVKTKIKKFVTWKTVGRVALFAICTGHSVIESSTRVSQDEQTAIAHCSAATAAAAARSSRLPSSTAVESHWSGIRNLLFEASAVPTRLQFDVSYYLV